MPTEFTFGSLAGNRAATGFVGVTNPSDTYSFSLSSTQNVNLSLTGLTNDASLRLFRAADINGYVESIQEIAKADQIFSPSELINRVLEPGNYVVEVDRGINNFGFTNYALSLSADNSTTIPTQTFNVGNLNEAHAYTGTVSSTNATDLYRFNLTTTSNLNLSLTGMSNDADLILARDLNRNGVIDAGEEIASSKRSSNFDELIRRLNLSAGDYIAEVAQYSGDTHYRLGLTATTVDTPTSGIDLTGSFLSVSPPDTRRPVASEAGQAQITLVNSGTQFALGPVTVNLYASTNQTYDSNDELLGSQTLNLSLAPGQSQVYTFTVGAPTVVAPASYYLLGRIDANNAIAERNETNNLISTHVSAPGSDVVLDWNATLLNAIQASNIAPPVAARDAAIVQAAIYDAVNAIDRQHTAFEPNLNLSVSYTSGASIIAAAAQAAYQTLVELFPSQRSEFDAQLARSLAEVPDGFAEMRGIEIGQFVADNILSDRLNDGSGGAQTRYTTSTRAGSYQSTNANNFVLLPGWGNVTPFAIPNAASYVPGGPPAYGSAQYAVQLNEVQSLGGINSTTRTANQTDSAFFWSYDRPDTFRPPAQWNVIAETIALDQGSSIAANARLFAQLNIAQADAGIAAWNAKYTYNQLRPITAIRQANNDGNPLTIQNDNWQSLLPTPPFPDYVSGHSTFGAAAAGVLASFFGNNYSFSVTSQEMPGTYRSYTSFQQAAAENGESRVLGGVHVQAANQDGQSIGYNIANYVTRNVLV